MRAGFEDGVAIQGPGMKSSDATEHGDLGERPSSGGAVGVQL